VKILASVLALLCLGMTQAESQTIAEPQKHANEWRLDKSASLDLLSRGSGS
jgi:hypothetical protein